MATLQELFNKLELPLPKKFMTQKGMLQLWYRSLYHELVERSKELHIWENRTFGTFELIGYEYEGTFLNNGMEIPVKSNRIIPTNEETLIEILMQHPQAEYILMHIPTYYLFYAGEDDIREIEIWNELLDDCCQQYRLYPKLLLKRLVGVKCTSWFTFSNSLWLGLVRISQELNLSPYFLDILYDIRSGKYRSVMNIIHTLIEETNIMLESKETAKDFKDSVEGLDTLSESVDRVDILSENPLFTEFKEYALNHGFFWQSNNEEDYLSHFNSLKDHYDEHITPRVKEYNSVIDKMTDEKVEIDLYHDILFPEVLASISGIKPTTTKYRKAKAILEKEIMCSHVNFSTMKFKITEVLTQLYNGYTIEDVPTGCTIKFIPPHLSNQKAYQPQYFIEGKNLYGYYTQEELINVIDCLTLGTSEMKSIYQRIKEVEDNVGTLVEEISSVQDFTDKQHQFNEDVVAKLQTICKELSHPHTCACKERAKEPDTETTSEEVMQPLSIKDISYTEGTYKKSFWEKLLEPLGMNCKGFFKIAGMEEANQELTSMLSAVMSTVNRDTKNNFTVNTGMRVVEYIDRNVGICSKELPEYSYVEIWNKLFGDNTVPLTFFVALSEVLQETCQARLWDNVFTKGQLKIECKSPYFVYSDLYYDIKLALLDVTLRLPNTQEVVLRAIHQLIYLYSEDLLGEISEDKLKDVWETAKAIKTDKAQNGAFYNKWSKPSELGLTVSTPDELSHVEVSTPDTIKKVSVCATDTSTGKTTSCEFCTQDGYEPSIIKDSIHEDKLSKAPELPEIEVEYVNSVTPEEVESEVNSTSDIMEDDLGTLISLKQWKDICLKYGQPVTEKVLGDYLTAVHGDCSDIMQYKTDEQILVYIPNLTNILNKLSGISSYGIYTKNGQIYLKVESKNTHAEYYAKNITSAVLMLLTKINNSDV